MQTLIKHFGLTNVRVMVFVDGENLAVRCGALMSEKSMKPGQNVRYRKNVYIWNHLLGSDRVVAQGAVIRTYYYAAVQGDHPLVEEVECELKDLQVGAPRVFKKAQGARSKQVDISLSVDMLVHATRRNYDIAVLVAGDADYIPLVRAVQAEGRGVHLWSVSSGLAPALVRAVDHHTSIEDLLLEHGT